MNRRELLALAGTFLLTPLGLAGGTRPLQASDWVRFRRLGSGTATVLRLVHPGTEAHAEALHKEWREAYPEAGRSPIAFLKLDRPITKTVAADIDGLLARDDYATLLRVRLNGLREEMAYYERAAVHYRAEIGWQQARAVCLSVEESLRERRKEIERGNPPRAVEVDRVAMTVLDLELARKEVDWGV